MCVVTRCSASENLVLREVGAELVANKDCVVGLARCHWTRHALCVRLDARPGGEVNDYSDCEGHVC